MSRVGQKMLLGACPPSLWLHCAFSGSNGTDLTAYTPDVGPAFTSWTTIYSLNIGASAYAKLYSNELRLTSSAGTTVGRSNAVNFPVPTATFDVSIDRTTAFAYWGNTTLYAGNAQMLFTANQVGKITCAVTGVGSTDVDVSPNWAVNTRYTFRITYDGANYRFYFRGTLIHTVAGDLTLKYLIIDQPSSSTAMTYIDNLKCYINMPNPAFGSY